MADKTRFPFDRWDERASVRISPRRLLAPEEGKLFFPPELVRVSLHPRVVQLGADAAFQAEVLHLLRYLDFTVQLEHEAVNSAARKIANRIIDLPESMRFAAYKLYCDEAYHALFSVDFIRQIQSATGISRHKPFEPSFLKKLQNLLANAPRGIHDLIEVLFAVVSETLITSTLVGVPHDERVQHGVREMIADHARDEAVHHAYFIEVFRTLWPPLPATLKRRMGVLLPEFIRWFLLPDQQAIAGDLRQLGLEGEEIEVVIHECFPQAEVEQGMNRAARPTLDLFTEMGVLGDGSVREAFEKCGLRADD